MNTKKITWGTIIAATVGLIGWDVFVATNGVPGDTISELIFSFAKSHPSMAGAFGILMGHLFWGRGKTESIGIGSSIMRLLGLIGSAGALVGADAKGILPTGNPIIYFLPGLILGKLFWSQKSATIE